MEAFFAYDPHCTGSKGLVFIGDKILVYRRDNNTKLFPFHLDLPGGGIENHETPFEIFQCETYEEFGLQIKRENIKYAKRYPSKRANIYTYFPVAKLPGEAESDIIFGDEGLEYMLLEFDDFLHRNDAWPVLIDRSLDYIRSLQTSL